jgi:hypothetical protein
MKISIDTVGKTIHAESICNLGELYDFLNQIFPKGEWKKYNLEINTVLEWKVPVPLFIPLPNPFILYESNPITPLTPQVTYKNTLDNGR